MTDPLAWLVVLPLLWGSVAFMTGPVHGAALGLVGLTLQLALAVAVSQQLAGGIEFQAIGGWAAPLGIEFALDGLSASMLLLTQLVALPLAIYARPYFALHPQGGDYFWPLLGYLTAALNALFLAGDIFNLYVTLELLGLASVGLVASGGGSAALAAAIRYLFVTLLGSGAYLLGVALLYGAYGTVSLRMLTPLLGVDAPNAAVLAAGLILAGLLLKTALLPFHFWLPPAHGGAPAPVSALLSGLVVKASFYLTWRFWTALPASLAAPVAAQLLGLLGTAAILWGSIMALRQARLKMLVAYSTVAQIGYLFLLFPLLTQSAPAVAETASRAMLLQVFAHGLAKAAMFAAAGAVAVAAGHDTIRDLRGMAARLPITLFAFGLAGVTLMGLPPSAGFLAKWLLIDSALSAGLWPLTVVLILGGLLTAAYVFKVLRQAFLQAEQAVTCLPLPRTLEWTALFLALASVGLGIHPGYLPGLANWR